jgi:two-component sensor histidine kinase
MILSPNDDGFAQQLEAIRQRLASLQVRVEAEPRFDLALQRDLVEALQATLEVLGSSEMTEVAQLRVALQEQEVLRQEIHHRVKNNLQIVSSLLDLQVLQTDDLIAQELLRDNQRRIRSIALVHDQLSQPENITEINLGNYIRNLATLLVGTYTIDERQVILRVEINADVLFSPDRAIPVGLILNELISNVFKHGLRDGAGEITIDLTITPDQQCRLRVQNTGNPFPADFDVTAARFAWRSSERSLGFQLIMSLVQQLEGTLSIDRDTPSDTTEGVYCTTVQVSFAVLS